MSEYNKIAEGTVTVTTGGTAQFLTLSYLPISFQMWNKTQWGTGGQIVQAIGFAEDTAGAAYYSITSGAATKLSTGGFSFVQAGQPAYGPIFTISSVSQASAALVTTSTNHGYAVGDVVLIYGTTGMLQIAGIAYTVQTVGSATTFTIDVNSSGFAAAATAGFVKKVLYPNLYLPGNRYITAVSTGTTTTITTAVNHNFVVGQEVACTVPSQWGMTQMDQAVLAAANPQTKLYVTAVTSNTLTVNLNSTAFTAFSYPTSATAALGLTFPQVTPIGDQNSGGSAPGGVLTSLTIPGAYLTNTTQGVLIGSTLFANTSDVWHYRAIYPDLISNQ